MCYLIAKKFDTEGCTSVKMGHGKALAALTTYLTQRTLDKTYRFLLSVIWICSVNINHINWFHLSGILLTQCFQ